MILVDSSIWIDHLRSSIPTLIRLLEHGSVVGHPWVTGELALGNLGNREEILALLRGLPQATVAQDDEILHLIEHERLAGLGIGYVDAQLLAATKLTPDCALWSRDKRLMMVAAQLRVGFESAPRPGPHP